MSAAELHIEDGVASLGGAITFSTVPGLYQRMQALEKGDAGMPTGVDLSKVSRIDSAGLALLLEWHALRRRRQGGDEKAALLEIRNPPEALLKIARLCDAEAYFRPGASSTSQNPETALS